MVRSWEDKKIVVLVEPEDDLFPKYQSFAESLEENGANEALLRELTLNFLEDFPDYAKFMTDQWDGMTLIAIRPLEIGVIIACTEREEQSDREREDVPVENEEIVEDTENSVTEDTDYESVDAIPETNSPVLTIFHFSSLEMMIQGVGQTRELDGTVYEDKDGFLIPMLIIDSDDANEGLALSDFTDYNRVEKKTYLLYLREHGKKLCTVRDLRKLFAWKGNQSC